MSIPFPFDFKDPDYKMAFAWRAERLERIRKNPEVINTLCGYYKDNPGQFIIDWGCTDDPRNATKNLPTIVPFLLFEKQQMWVNWVFDLWKNNKYGLVEKSRELGVTWLTVALSCTLCLFYPGINVGLWSRKEDYVDKIGDPKSLFEKARLFMEMLPVEFRFGWQRKTDAPFMRLIFRHNGSALTGDVGDNAGRGSRFGLGFRDEAAFYERPELSDRAVFQATPCLIDVSTPNGTNNPFYRRRSSGKNPVFSFHWRADPRKDEAWYQEQCDKIGDPVIIAQELDLNYAASTEGIIIPSEWVQAAIDAHVKLGIKPTGIRRMSLDVADEGRDLNAVVGGKGVIIDCARPWSGKDSDIFYSVQRAFDICDEFKCLELIHDADGLGAGVRGDARVLNDMRLKNRKIPIEVIPFRGSGAVVNPKQKLRVGEFEMSNPNEDYFANLKAQAWWILRFRFLITYRAVTKGVECDPDDIISISSEIEGYEKLMLELSQPLWKKSDSTGKIMVDKKPKGTASPNLADALMMYVAPRRQGFFDV